MSNPTLNLKLLGTKVNYYGIKITLQPSYKFLFVHKASDRYVLVASPVAPYWNGYRWTLQHHYDFLGDINWPANKPETESVCEASDLIRNTENDNALKEQKEIKNKARWREAKQFIQWLADQYAEHRSDVSDNCDAFLKTKCFAPSKYQREHRHIQAYIPAVIIETQAQRKEGLKVFYDTLTTEIYYEFLGSTERAEEHEYTD